MCPSLLLRNGDFAFCFSGKIDMVKSKWGLALAAVVTVLSSLLMSVGLCTLFGLTPTLNGGYVSSTKPLPKQGQTEVESFANSCSMLSP